jgi:hypothetical protein
VPNDIPWDVLRELSVMSRTRARSLKRPVLGGISRLDKAAAFERMAQWLASEAEKARPKLVSLDLPSEPV